MSEQLKGRVAVVTGAGRGIGRAIAFTLAAQGALVVAASRTVAEIEETAALIRANGGKVVTLQTDVSDYEAVQSLAAHALETGGRIDILVNNAGMQGPIGPLVDNDRSDWQRNISVNLFGTFNGCQAVLPQMIEQRSGKIINLSGGGATAPRPNFSAYSAAKAAIVRLTETLAEEVRQYNIQVNAVAPGAVNTTMLDEILQAGEDAGQEITVAQGRVREGGTAPEVAAALVTFLASDASAPLTGKLIAAPYDPWRSWDAEAMAMLSASPWLTLRRLDPFTLEPLSDGRKAQALLEIL